MTTADMSLVAKESIHVLVEKLKKNMPAQFFCPILYHHLNQMKVNIKKLKRVNKAKQRLGGQRSNV